MASRVKLNHAGIAAILKSGPMAAAVQAATEQVANEARARVPMVEGIPGDIAPAIETQMVTTDRAHGIVAIAHPSGLAVEAKHGLLSGSAGGSGMTVGG